MMDTSNRTKQHLSKTLIELTDSMPLVDISVKTLCEHSNVNRGTFYYHFRDIYDLINWTYYAQILEPTRRVMEACGIGEMPSITAMMLKRTYANKNFFIQAVNMEGQNCLSDYIFNESKENWKLLWEKALQFDIMDNEAYENAGYVLEYFWRGHFHATMQWIKNGMLTNPENFGKMLDDVALRGLVSIWQEYLGQPGE